MGRIGLRALTALLPLLAAAANGARATQPFPADAELVCTTSKEALRPGQGAPAAPLFLIPPGPATELAAKEAGREGPPVTRCPRSAGRLARLSGTGAARARAARLAYLDFRESLARAWLGSFFGSTAPPPLPG